MKTAEELNALKEEVENLNKKLSELTEEELAHVTGGYNVPYHLDSFGIGSDDITPKERDIVLTGNFIGNSASGCGGGIFNEGKL